MKLQVAEGLPVYVTPLRPLTRVLAQLREWEAGHAALTPAVHLRAR